MASGLREIIDERRQISMPQLLCLIWDAQSHSVWDNSGLI